MDEPTININDRRARRRKKRKESSQKMVIWVVAIVVFITSVTYGAVQLTQDKPEPKVASVKKEDKKTSFKELKENTYLVIGVGKIDDKEVAMGILQFVIDPNKSTIGGINIPTNTFVELSGRGFEPFSEGYSLGIDVLIKTAGDFLGVEPNHYIIINSDHFTSATGEGDIVKLFNLSYESDIDRKEMKKHIEKVEKIKAKNIAILDLPVKPISFGEATYFDPKKDELERIVKMFWGFENKDKDTDERVIILNGSGTPGVARKAADNLLGKGFKIIDVKNADRFDYKETQIIIYDEKKMEIAKEVKERLGKGVIATTSMPQNIVDVLIVVGQDY